MIPIKTPKEIKIMAEGGKILARVMRELEKWVKPGMTPQKLDRLAESLILKSGGQCSFNGYDGFPGCLCVSLNNVVVHGVPSGVELKEGDVVSLDIGMIYPSDSSGGVKGFQTDMARTWALGKTTPEVTKLLEVTKKALEVAVNEAKPGNHFGDIESSTQRYVESHGFNVVRQLCGHGIGQELHEEPQIMNFGKKGTGAEIKEGMVFCIEPMVTAGKWELKISSDGFGYETVDGSLTCHFEDMVLVTKNGYQILTK